MVLSSANDGKYLSRKWQEDRQAALVDRSRFTAAELTWLEVTSTQGIVNEADERIYQADTVPLDPLTRSRKYDIRKPGRR